MAFGSLSNLKEQRPRPSRTLNAPSALLVVDPAPGKDLQGVGTYCLACRYVDILGD